jgi:hypothetical protein
MGWPSLGAFQPPQVAVGRLGCVCAGSARAPAGPYPVERSQRQARAHRVLFVSPLVAQAVLVEACSRKEFFDELADNLEARSERYTPQSGPGIIALF